MKRYIPYILFIVIGLTVAIVSYVYLDKNTSASEIETIKIVVPVKDIHPYKAISTGDLSYKEIPVDDINDNIITNPQDIIGNYAKSTLYADWKINKQDIAKDMGLKNKHIIAININYVRSAGAKPGDVVDVFHVKPLLDIWTTDPAEKVVDKAIVLAIEDIKGGDVESEEKGSAAVAILAVDTEYTTKLAPGAMDENKSYVLAIRHEIEENNEGGEASDD